MFSSIHSRKACALLERGGVIAYPTEGVYGIGCLPHYNPSVQRVINIKGRPSDAGLILIAADISLLQEWIAPTAQERENLLKAVDYPTTWIVSAQPSARGLLTGERETIAVRITTHPVAAELSWLTGSALVSTSANRTGKRPTKTALTARLRLGKAVDYVISGALGNWPGASEIRIAANNQVLRPRSPIHLRAI